MWRPRHLRQRRGGRDRAGARATGGNFGGGALVAPPKELFGPGNVVIGAARAARAPAGDRGDGAGQVRRRRHPGRDEDRQADGSFAADGSATQTPEPEREGQDDVQARGHVHERAAVEGTVSATLGSRADRAETQTCKTGKIAFGARRPDGEIGKRGARPRARYFGTTAQRGIGPRRPIVLRLSGDGRRISRALFGEQVKCSDGKRSIGVEAPRTNIAIDSDGPRLRSRDSTRSTTAQTFTYVDDRFTALVGRDGAKGTFSLSDRTIDKLTGNVIQSCRSGDGQVDRGAVAAASPSRGPGGARSAS